MLISCDCSIECDDVSELDRSDIHKARMAHLCGECGRTIKIGERYEVYTIYRDMEFSRHKTCLGCMRIRDHLCRHGWIFGGVAGQVEECVGFNYVTGRLLSEPILASEDSGNER